MYFDQRFYKKEKRIRRNFEIDDVLYNHLYEFTKIYDATIVDLINACIENLIQNSKPHFYETEYKPLYVAHTMRIRISNIEGLEKLKDKYGISLFRLVNMAIHYTINQQ